MKRTTLLTIIALISGATIVEAQTKEVWSLQKCINHAQENNLTIKMRSLGADYAKNQYNQKKFDLAPSLNANSGYSVRMGRVRNEVNYEISDVTTSFTDLSISSSVPVFEGFARRNTITQSIIDWQTSVKDVEKARNDLSLNIAALYLQILFDKELLEASKSQLELVKLQVDRTQSLVMAGSLPEGSLLEIKSQASREALNVTRLENSLNLSLLDLAQALDLEKVESFDIETPAIDDISGFTLVNADEAFTYSVAAMPQIAAAELKLKSSELDKKIAQGYQWPRLSLSAGWGTSVAKFKGDPDFNFGRSFRDNATTFYGLNLSIPIFNGYSVRTGIKNAQIGILNAQYEVDRQKQILKKEIQQASADAVGALRQYQAGKSAVDSYEESFRYTEKRFGVGMVNSVEYNIAKTELIKAQSEFIQAKYSYILRTKILDFYMGKPIVL